MSSAHFSLKPHGSSTGFLTPQCQLRVSRPENTSKPRVSQPKRMLRQPGYALTTVISAVTVTSSSAPAIVPA